MPSSRSSLAVTVLFVTLVVAQPSGGEPTVRFSDDFKTLNNLRGVENVAQRPDFPRIVTRPDVRINRTTPKTTKTPPRAR